MASSRALPSLERKPGGPDNWVERVGGLPKYIELIAKHLHYKEGFTISHAIATAVNTVKRWARKGTVVKYNDPKNNRVYTITAAKAAKDVAEWNAKRARARTSAGSTRSGRLRGRSIKLSEVSVNITALAERANAISDPTAKAAARRAVYDLAFPDGPPEIDLAVMASVDKASVDAMVRSAKATINALGPLLGKTTDQRVLSAMVSQIQQASDTIRQTRWWKDDGTVSLSKRERKYIDLAMTKDGRKSFKRQGKWGHGFVPLDAKAKQAKAKGSSIAAKRVDRLFGSPTKAANASRAATKATLAARAKKGAAHGTQIRANTGRKGGGQQERVQDVGQSLHADVRDARASQRAKVKTQREDSITGKRRASTRATQPWDAIPESQKTVRNGKKYVLAVFNGRQLLTEWQGNNPAVAAPDESDRQYTRVREADLQKMSTGQLRKLLKSGKQSKAAQKTIARVLKKKTEKAARTA